MKENGLTFYERLVFWILSKIREYRAALGAAWISGLAAHMYMFTNKIVNHDDVLYLFAKGGTVGSGRWLLALSDWLFPNVSMPWIYGLISLAITSAAICFIVKLYGIRNGFWQGILAGLIVCFPAQTSIFCFMFTSAPYALALLGAVASVYVCVRREGRGRFVLSTVILTLTLGLYQGYVAVASSLFIICMIQDLLNGKKAADVFRDGVRYVAVLTVSVAAYYGITCLTCYLTGAELLVYGFSEEKMLIRLLLPYNGFLRTFVSGYFGFVNSTASMLAHIAVLIVILVLIVGFSMKSDKKTVLLLMLCGFLFPMSVYCLYLIAETGVINSWTMYPFVCTYILAVVIADRLADKKWMKDVLLISMTVVILSNVYFANKVYLKMYLGNESTFAYYSAMAADIRKCPEYEDGMRVTVLGDESDMVNDYDEIDTGLFTGPADNTLNMYTRNFYLTRFIGLDVKLENGGRKLTEIERSEEYAAMPDYPAEGSIAVINGTLVVKLA